MPEERKPTCFDCIHAKIDPGEPCCYESPGYPAYLEDCRVEFGDASEETVDELFQVPGGEAELIKLCHRFEPRLIKACTQCKKDINQPEWSWEFWAMQYESVPCCSKECVDLANAEFEKEMKQLTEIPDDIELPY